MWKSWKRREWGAEEGRTDYGEYFFSVREACLCVVKCIAVTGAFAYLFYHSWYGFLALPAVLVFGFRKEKKEQNKRRKERLSLQFKDTILAVSASIQAGYSIENAFLEAEGEIRTLYGGNSEMAGELALLRQGLFNRVPLEQMLQNLGARSHVEEIRDFTECFTAAKRLGGNLKEIIARTAELTGQRMEVEREIQTMLAAKKYEQKVMNLIPFLLFGYMQLSSPGFFDVLYHNAAGICIMTLCLVLYLAALFLSEKIMNIRL